MFARWGQATRNLRAARRFRNLVCPAPAASPENPAENAPRRKQLIPAGVPSWQPSESIRRGDTLKYAAQFPDRCKPKYPDVPGARVTKLPPRTHAGEVVAGKAPCLRRPPNVPIRAIN